jgi:uncharacterized membrane protein YozB (DUF420 family)
MDTVRRPQVLMLSYDSLAPLDAILNATAGVLLIAGFVAVRRHRIRVHRVLMLSAFAVSIAFLISYCIYHYHVGDVRFEGQGAIRPVYFTILISHITLAAVIVPLVLITLIRALRGRFVKHRAIARWTLPLWVYVSVTGVVVYLLLFHFYPHLVPGTGLAHAPPAHVVASATNRQTP